MSDRATDQQIDKWEAIVDNWFYGCGDSAVAGEIIDALRAEHTRVTELEREAGALLGRWLAVSAHNSELAARVSAREIRIAELENALAEKRAQLAEMDCEHARIAGLEQQAVPWRCMATTSMANMVRDDHRAVWCTLPNGHAGLHHAEIEIEVPIGSAEFTKAIRSQMHWSDVQEPSSQPEVTTSDQTEPIPTQQPEQCWHVHLFCGRCELYAYPEGTDHECTGRRFHPHFGAGVEHLCMRTYADETVTDWPFGPVGELG
ncbi:hypothetical protein [Nocardia sp. NPDC004711]